LYNDLPGGIRDIVNENLHVGDTLNPEIRIDGQSELSFEFMKENFKKQIAKNSLKTDKKANDIFNNSLFLIEN